MEERLKNIKKMQCLLEEALRVIGDDEYGSLVFSFCKDEIELIIDAVSRLMPCETEENAAAKPDDTENRSPYAATVDGMLSPDYKERFKAEYRQTKIRYEKLKSFCNRIEASMRTCPGDTKRVQMPEHDCPLDLLRDQQRAMGEYLHCLEIRAVIEGIDL
jgi:hypothetical protein